MKELNGKCNIITDGQYYEQYRTTVLSKMKKGTGNLAYFDKNNYSFQDWNRNTCSKKMKKLVIKIPQ